MYDAFFTRLMGFVLVGEKMQTKFIPPEIFENKNSTFMFVLLPWFRLGLVYIIL